MKKSFLGLAVYWALVALALCEMICAAALWPLWLVVVVIGRLACF